MNGGIVFLSISDVLSIHNRMVDKYGGDGGIRDYALLESAVCSPQASFGGKLLNATIYEQAAALMVGLCKNHPFVDGNKRTALASTIVFIEMNGHLFQATNQQAIELTLSVATGKFGKKQVAVLLENWTM